MKLHIASLRMGVTTIVAILALFSLSVSTVTAAELSLGSLEAPKLSLPSLTTTSLTLEPVTCNIHLDSTEIVTGESVTVSWTTSGLDEISINGELVSGASGQMTLQNIIESTTFTLVGSNDDGGTCHANIHLVCVPPVIEECELELHKSVDKTAAKPGDELTYTITIENTGEKNCTGGGVKIHDVVDAGLAFVSQSVSSNLSPGYEGQPLYSTSDRTLRWNGHDLTPGETGNITWVGKVKTPDTCGDFEIQNQAKATAKELNNFQDWAHSNKVTTTIDNDCVTPDCTPGGVHYNPEGDLSGYIFNGQHGEVTNSSEYCSYDVGLASYEKFDEIIDNQKLFDYELGTVAPKSSITLKVEVPECAYQIDLFYGDVLLSLDGQRYGERLLDAKHLNSDKGYCGVTTTPSCDLFTADPAMIRVGESSLLTWETTNATQVFINNGIGNVAVDGSLSVSPLETVTYVLTAIGDKDKTVDCHVAVKVDSTPERPECPFTPGPHSFVFEFDEKLRSDQSLGNSQTDVQTATFPIGTYDIRLASWDSYPSRVNVTQPNEQWQLEFLSGTTQVGLSGVISDLPDKIQAAYLEEQVNSKYALMTAADGVRAVHAVYPDAGSPNSVEPICAVVEKVEDPAPSCDSFTATPGTIFIGSTSTLAWETSNATRVVINNGIGEVSEDGSLNVSPLIDTVYQMTVFGTNDRSVTCEAPVTVSEDPVPVCVAFTASPTNLPLGGGEVTLNWEVEEATTVTISPTVGTVGLTGSTSVAVTESTTFTLVAQDSNGDETSCVAAVSVPDPVPFTCENNVSFNASPNSIRRGSDVTLNWNVTDADSVFISVIDETSFSGSEVVNPSSDTTYVLTATLGENTIECPASITVSTGGGGGGSSSPRCELDISDQLISLGDEITLTWDTSRAENVTLSDDEGNIIFSTTEMLSTDKDEYLDGSITLAPTRDTRYSLVAERGSRDETCRVAVEIEDDIVILETRDQQPLVAGISLSSVPYTGFEAGPFVTFMFYALLIAWAFYIAYLVVIRKQMTTVTETSDTSHAVSSMQTAEVTRPDVFVQSVTTPTETESVSAPQNLPVDEPQVGYEAHQVSDTIVTDIEDRAHAQKALLSSDAIRHFLATTEGSVERHEVLDEVIAEAKKGYPLEDGWIVINESRMKNLCEACAANAEQAPQSFSPTLVPQGSSSLAEAIVTGNVMAAYEMIGHRPMFSLADAAADLDALYRKRQGESKVVSELLEREAETLSDEQISNMINALTSALDGTYTSEAAAVKIAIMKAVKEVA